MAGKGIKASTNLQARIKKMMQSDEDVGKVSKASPVLIAKALDVFLQSIVEGAAQIATGRGARMLTQSHIKAHIEGEVVLDFLKDAVAGVPALPPASEEPKPKQKRQRAKNGDGDGGPAKVRGRGRGGRGGRAGRGGRGRGRKGSSAADDADEAAEADVATEPDPAAAGEQEMAGCVAGAEPQQLTPQQDSAGDNEQLTEPEAAAAPPAGEAGMQQTAGGTDDAIGSAAVAVAPLGMPGFLMAAAVPGAEAEEEDYDA